MNKVENYYLFIAIEFNVMWKNIPILATSSYQQNKTLKQHTTQQNKTKEVYLLDKTKPKYTHYVGNLLMMPANFPYFLLEYMFVNHELYSAIDSAK